MEYSVTKIAGYKWPVSISRKIEVSPERIWSSIAAPGNLEDCHPFCEKNPVSNWPGVGAKDTIYYYSGWILEREFVDWMEGIGYDLTIGRAGGRKSYVSWRITEEGAGLGRLRITIYPHIFVAHSSRCSLDPTFGYCAASATELS